MTTLLADNIPQAQAMELWVNRYQEAAQAQGWDIFLNTDTTEGTESLQIQRLDETAKFESDSSAWELVVNGQDECHAMAREIIKRYSNKEWQLIALHLAKERGAAV